MVKKQHYEIAYIFHKEGVFRVVFQMQWNRVFVHVMSGNRKIFSVRIDQVKKEKEDD